MENEHPTKLNATETFPTFIYIYIYYFPAFTNTFSRLMTDERMDQQVSVKNPTSINQTESTAKD